MRMTHASRILTVTLLLGVAAGCDRPAELPTGAARQPEAGLAPLRMAAKDPVPGQYVVVLKAGADNPAATTSQVAAAAGATPRFTYGHALHGFAARLTPQAVEQLRRDPRVAYVAEDAMAFPTATTQPNATWGLDRIDQRNLPLNTTYVYTPTGLGVRVYVIDTGIRTTHSEFGGRASVGADFVNDGQNGQDCHGHGTHVSGTIAGNTYGVAKKAQVIAVRVFGCSGGAQYSTIIAAVDWVTAHAQKPAVVNMSLGGGYYAPVNQAVQASIASGVVYAVAAGNESSDACSVSPASTPEAITVGASTSSDYPAYFSNWGSCLDIFAPGLDITSAWMSGDSATNTISGTSMATPHVAGVAALVLQGQPTATPAAVAAKIASTGTHNRLNGVYGGSPNNLLFSGLTAEPPLPVIALSPASLGFNLVRLPAGYAAAAGASAGVAAPPFAAAGTGPAKVSVASSIVEVAATATTATSRVLLSNPGTGPLEWSATSGQSWLKMDPLSGAVEPGSLALLNATVTAGSMAAGSYAGSISFRGTGAPNSPLVLPVAMNVADALSLTPNAPRSDLSGASGSLAFFVVQVPNTATSVRVAIAGSSGDADLYVRYGAPPTTTQFDCRPYSSSSTETCETALPQPGLYYVMIRGYTAYSGVTLTAAIGGIPTAPRTLVGTVPTATSIKLAWSDLSLNEASFRLDRQVQNGSGVFGSYSNVANPAANSVSYTNTGLVAGSVYRYRLRACNSSGCSGWAYSNILTLPGVTTPPSVSAAVLSATSARVTWVDASTNETQFTVMRGTMKADSTWGVWSNVATPPAGSTTVDDTGLAAGHTYRYQVRACNGALCSMWRVTSPVTTPAS